MLTVEQIKALEETGILQEHHTARRRGYVSRKTAGRVEAYSGRFGHGFVVLSPRWDTTVYCYVTYYIKVAQD